MKYYKKIERILLKCINFFWKIFILIHEYKNIFNKRNMFKEVKLTKEQKQQIDNFYKDNYGKKVKYWWHRLYMSYTGKFDYKYVPEYIYSTKIEPLTNNRIKVLPYEDKNMLSVLFGSVDVRIPESFIMCINGKYFNEKREIISKESAIDILKNKNDGTYEAVIKITTDTNSGKGVRVLSLINGRDINTKKLIEEIFEEMGNNFVVQEKIIQHESLSKIYEDSINTLRVITYLLDDGIKIAPITMRVGQGGAKVDNLHNGGMFIAVDDETGKLNEVAFTESGSKIYKHPNTGVVFKELLIPNIDQVKKVAIELHKKVLMIKFASWDFTIDEKGDIVLIEANLHSQSIWFPQMAHGKSVFGEDTVKMLKSIKRR